MSALIKFNLSALASIPVTWQSGDLANVQTLVDNAPATSSLTQSYAWAATNTKSFGVLATLSGCKYMYIMMQHTEAQQRGSGLQVP